MSGRKNTLITQLVNPVNSTKVFSLSSAFNSPATVVRFSDNCSYQINIATTDSTGTFAVQVSDDYFVNEANGEVVMNPGNWINLTLAGGTPFANAINDFIAINLNQLPFYAVRLSYTPTVPGTGTCAIFISNKTVGA